MVADVATGNRCAATLSKKAPGRIMEVYVVVPVEGKLVLTRGGIYSQYEFVQPTSDRLTDEQWRQRLDNNAGPAHWGLEDLYRQVTDRDTETKVRLQRRTFVYFRAYR